MNNNELLNNKLSHSNKVVHGTADGIMTNSTTILF